MKVLTTIDLLVLPSLETPPTGHIRLGAKSDGLYQKIGTVETKLSIDGHTHTFASLTSKPSTLSGYGIEDATPSSHIGSTGSAHGIVTTSVNGFMSAADKVKLNGIATGATANIGTVTSVAMTVPTGLSISGSPITTSGTLVLSLTSGYSIPTTAKQTQWDTAYTHISNVSNPHNVTKAQVGLGNVLNVASYSKTESDGRYSAASHTHSFASITDKPATFAPSAHTLDSHSNVVITSNTSGEILKWDGSNWINNTLSQAGIAAASHTHSFSSITSKPSTLSGYGITDAASSSHTHTFASLTSKPTTLSGYGITDAASSGHTHSFSSLTSKPTSLSGYGITDAVTNNTTQTISGTKTFSAALTASVSVTTPKVIFTAAGWSVEQSGTEIQFKYNGSTKQRLLNDGSIVAVGELTAFG